MNDPRDDVPELEHQNPFATRSVRPGAIGYLFRDGQAVASILDQLAAHGWRGQIVGPHGSGKSTLLATLIPAIESAGRKVVLVALHEGQRRLPAGVADSSARTSREILLLAIDGYEQLSRWNRWRTERFCRNQDAGLLVTSHTDVGLPTVALIEPDLDTLRRVVRELTDTAIIVDRDIEQVLKNREGNLREALFDLYDLYEERRPR